MPAPSWPCCRNGLLERRTHGCGRANAIRRPRRRTPGIAGAGDHDRNPTHRPRGNSRSGESDSVRRDHFDAMALGRWRAHRRAPVRVLGELPLPAHRIVTRPDVASFHRVPAPGRSIPVCRVDPPLRHGTPGTSQGRNGLMSRDGPLTPREVAHRAAIVRRAHRWYLARAGAWFPASRRGTTS